ncbi:MULTISPECIES: Uma2 family endonuclease [Streptomyces]|uniref:Restriction endonuclease n=1 Tax=Streptomyces amritsarensis TaxID=681158 RepID=A0ABX3G8U9_9ACTN|nr:MULTISPECIES: Uma2 family endonuclease [Streptomyces]AQT74075.1 restriction endonuclease [Streptomyces sp. fd1-xmd]OLZ69175.1 restriction endonuclease [Streptomyces amritsarensis]
MSALAVEHPPLSGGDDWDSAVGLWKGTGAPKGCKVEIIEGIVTVAPPPVNDHNLIAELVQQRLYSVIPDGWGVFQTLNVAIPSRSGLYIPDLAVVPRKAVPRGENFTPADAAELVVEITSRSNAVHDRVAKLNGYAAAGIPLYLLIDPHATGSPTIHLYGESSDGKYRVLWAGKFGETVPLPAPFDLALDTFGFPRP